MKLPALLFSSVCILTTVSATPYTAVQCTKPTEHAKSSSSSIWNKRGKLREELDCSLVGPECYNALKNLPKEDSLKAFESLLAMCDGSWSKGFLSSLSVESLVGMIEARCSDSIGDAAKFSECCQKSFTKFIRPSSPFNCRLFNTTEKLSNLPDIYWKKMEYDFIEAITDKKPSKQHFLSWTLNSFPKFFNFLKVFGRK
jgi:hypothetical protein